MRHGKELILATRPYAKEIRWKSWYFTASTYLLLIGLLTTIALLQNIFAKIGCSIFTGFVIVRLFVIYHDYQHHAILQKSIVAKIIFRLFGLFILAPESIWKRSHDYHHNHNSKLFSASIGSFPIYTKEKFMKSSSAEKKEYLFVRHPLTVMFGFVIMFFYGMCVQSFISSPRRHWDSMLAMVLHLTAAVLFFYFGGWVMWLLVWFVPFLIACGLGSYLFYAQHNFPGVTFKNNVEWSYEHAALESSSYMKMNFFWRWVTANIGYHHIHHINSRIPFYRLPEVMSIFPEMQKAKTTTLYPKDIIACFKLKVWDPEKNEMIPV
jgi:omega-6 fatty acid desaturase (delta-12 desaturase)